MSEATTSDSAFDLPGNELTPRQTIEPSARLALVGAALGLLPSAYRWLRRGEDSSGNTAKRTATEAAVGAGLLGVIPWAMRPRFRYSVPGTFTPQPRAGETRDAYNERTRIKSWDDVNDRLYLPRDKEAAFRKVAQAAAARNSSGADIPRDGGALINLSESDIDNLLAANRVRTGTPAAVQPPSAQPRAPRRTLYQAAAENQAAREGRSVQSVYDDATNRSNQIGKLYTRGLPMAAAAGGTLAAAGPATLWQGARHAASYAKAHPFLTGLRAMNKGFGIDAAHTAYQSGKDWYALKDSPHIQDRTEARDRGKQTLANLAVAGITQTPWGLVSKLPAVQALASKLPTAGTLTSKLPWAGPASRMASKVRGAVTGYAQKTPIVRAAAPRVPRVGRGVSAVGAVAPGIAGTLPYSLAYYYDTQADGTRYDDPRRWESVDRLLAARRAARARQKAHNAAYSDRMRQISIENLSRKLLQN